MNNWITGVDIGGTHITVAMVNPEECTLLENTLVRQTVYPNESAAEIMAGWSAAIRACWKLAGLAQAKIGIAMPGPFDYEKGISLIKDLCKYDALYKLPVKALLAEKLGSTETEIRMVNDATAYLRGEMGMGSGKGAGQVLGITLGTGLGSALFRNGNYEDGDLYCFPFRDDLAEEYFSTRWFLKRYKEKKGYSLPGVKELAELCETDTEALECFYEFGENLDLLIRSRYAPEIPTTIVIGGNIAKASSLFFPVLQEKLGPEFHIRKAVLGEKAALIGAAFLWAPTL